MVPLTIPLAASPLFDLNLSVSMSEEDSTVGSSVEAFFSPAVVQAVAAGNLATEPPLVSADQTLSCTTGHAP